MRRRRAAFRRFLLGLALAVLAGLVLATAAAAAPLASSAAATTNLEKWNLIVGFALPPVIALVKQTHWPIPTQALLTFGASCVAAIGTCYWKSELTSATWLESALTILVATVAVYHGFWKPTGIADRVAAVTDRKPAAKKK